MTMTPLPPRGFIAADLLSGRVQLHGYPLTFVFVTTPGRAGQEAIQTTMAAAELLEAQGWRVVNFAEGGRDAFLRREPGPGSPSAPPPIQQYGQ